MGKSTSAVSIRIVRSRHQRSNTSLLLLHLGILCLIIWVLAQLYIHKSIARIAAAANEDVGAASETAVRKTGGGVSHDEQQRLLALVAAHLSSPKEEDGPNPQQQQQQQNLTRVSGAPAARSNSSHVFDKSSNWARPSKDYVIDPTDLWEQQPPPQHNNTSNRQLLPPWMIQYFRFHKEQRQQSRSHHHHHASTTVANTTQDDDNNPHQPQQTPPTVRYLCVTCLAEYRKCGGAADRLLPLPFLVRVAAQSQRLLVIQWTRPAPLEEFLLPPVGGVDWRVVGDSQDGSSSSSSNMMLQAKSGVKAGVQDSIVELSQNASIEVLQVKFQSHDHGSAYYNSFVAESSEDEPDFETVFAAVWRVFFTPTRKLQAQIAATLQAHRLVPGSYAAAHLRALYGRATREETQLQAMAENAVRCAVRLQHGDGGGGPIVYFASDSELAVQKATVYGAAHGVHVTSRSNIDNSEAASSTTATDSKKQQLQQQHDPLHLDKTRNWRKRPPSDFFDVFVDLYLLGLGRCVAIGVGGYGKLASLMISSHHCVAVHTNATDLADCAAALPPATLERRSSNNHGRQQQHLVRQTQAALLQSIFLPPMPELS